MDSIQSGTTLTILLFVFDKQAPPDYHVEFAFRESLEEGHKQDILNVLRISLIDQDYIHSRPAFDCHAYLCTSCFATHSSPAIFIGFVNLFPAGCRNNDFGISFT